MFKIGDKVKFKKYSLDSGMVDATEDDVFMVVHINRSHEVQIQIWITSYPGWWNVGHFEHVKEEIVNNTEEQEIKWEIGQEVFCLLRGKGVVRQIYNTGVYWSEGVDVYFGGHGVIRFKFDGTIGTGFNRSIFFSEPKIEAEKFPPKKPFVPVLKKGDVILVKSSGYKEGIVRTVYEELEDIIVIDAKGDFHAKSQIHSIHRIGEEIIFN